MKNSSQKNSSVTIGILTYSDSINFGAVLQAMALERVLNSISGVESEVIDYRSSSREHHKFFPIKLYKIRHLIAEIVFGKSRKEKRKKFEKYNSEFMNFSQKQYSGKTIKQAEKEYDVLCVGSDQVWNPEIGEISDFLLEFAGEEIKRFSYSSSFKILELPEEYKHRFACALKTFQFISVRENAGKKIILDLIGREVPVTLDPSLLLDETEWMDYEQDISLPNSFVAVYMQDNSFTLLEFAKKIAVKRNCVICVISDRYYTGRNIINLNGISPGQFLHVFRNADVIVTNAFHGTAFAINLKRQVWVESLVDRDARIINLLNSVGIEKRIINLEIDESSDIDYIQVEKKLKELRKPSYQYLKEAVDYMINTKLEHDTDDK